MSEDVSFGSLPIVGRDQELARVEASLAVGRSVALVGGAGMGKSRLAEACRDAATDAGMFVLTASATAASSRLTLGALAHLLPPAADLSNVHDDLRPAHLLQATSAALRERAGGRRLLLVVDDAHHLDPVAVHLVHQLVAGEVAQALLTIRTGDGQPERPDATWSDPHVDHVEVRPLGRRAVADLATALLDGPVDEATVAWLHDVSGANALYLRELALGGRDEGALVQTDGRWSRSADVGGGPGAAVPAKLGALVDHRLEDLDDEQRRATELIALAEPLPLDVAEDLVSLDVLDALDRRGLLKVSTEGRRLTLALAHPLYGESLRRRTLTVRRRADLARLIDSVVQRGARRREDAVRMAAWQLARGAAADPEVLARAAVAAQLGFDDARSVELATAGLDQDLTQAVHLRVELHLCRGVSRCRIGRFDDAVDDLVAASGPDATPEQFARAAMTLAAVYADVRGDLESALTLLADAVERVAAAPGAAADLEVDLRLARAVLLSDCGFAERCRRELAALDRDALRPGQRVVHDLASAAERLAAGRPVEAIEVGERGLHEHLSHIDEVTTYHPASHFLPRLSALVDLGELDRAERDARWLLARGEREGRSTGSIVTLAILAAVAMRRGRPRSALIEVGRAARPSSASQLYVRRALAGLEAQAHAALGDLAAARAAVDAMAAMPSQSTDFLLMEEVRGRVAVLVLEGRRDDAAQLLDEVAATAVAHTSVRIELAALDELARVRPDTAVATRLGALAAADDGAAGALAALVADEAAVRSLPTTDAGAAKALATVAEGFAAAGLTLRAAEGMGEAADRARATGDSRAATAAARGAAELLASCEGSRTTAVVGVGAPSPLTAREREIALLVVGGATSREVGEQLFLSRRTVDNHLQRIYAKLGVAGRQGLGEYLAGS